jgi:methanogenic corrinoid protein MtbC1
MTNLGRRDADQLLPPLVCLRNGLESLLTAPDLSEPVVSADVREFLDLILNRRRRDATEFALRHARTGGAESCTEFVGPALDEIGRLWELNRISVADEHAATDICRHVIFRLCDELPRAKHQSLSALIACVPGEEHDLAGEMLADRLEALGWTAHFVGHSLPEPDLVEMAAEVKPDVIILSITLVENLAGLRHLLKDLRSSAPGARLMLGGPAAVTARESLLGLCDAVAGSIPDAVAILRAQHPIPDSRHPTDA